MKKLLIYVILVGTLVSCNLSQESTVINNSKQQVSFQLSNNDPKIISLNSDESVSIDGGFAKIYNLKPEKRLSQNWSEGNIITITDIQPYKVYVLNTLPFSVILKENFGWMDELTIPEYDGEQINSLWFIYTEFPHFSAYFYEDNIYKDDNEANKIEEYHFPIHVDYETKKIQTGENFYIKIY